jgi:hypothetical protein
MARLFRSASALLIFLFSFILVQPIHGQDNPLQLKINGTYHNQTIIQVLHRIEESYPVQFYYDPDKLPTYRQSFQFDQLPLYQTLGDLLAGTNLLFILYDSRHVVILPRQRRDKAYAEELIRRWEEGEIRLPRSDQEEVIRRIFGDSTAATAGHTLHLRGTLTDEQTGAPIIGAAVGQPGTSFGTTTGADGAFQLQLPAGRHQLQVQYIGYRPVQLELGLFADGRLDLALTPQPLALDEIIVRAEADDRQVSSAQIGVEKLAPQTIRKLPAFLGEADVVQSLKLLPGVNTAGEGAGGFNVRGGHIDQNLILQDGLPIYNASHALGFFSIFPADAIENVTLYKGNIPAQYGGRTASVLDVDLREGHLTEFHGQGGAGLIASRLLLEGPVWKNHLSFLVNGRIAYPNYLLRKVEDPDVNSSAARFSDFHGKLSQRIGEHTKIEGSVFHSSDFFRFADEFGYEWENTLLNLGWKQLFSDRLSSTLSAGQGRYDSRQFDPEGNDAFDFFTGLHYYKAKADLTFIPNKQHLLHAGIEWLYQDTRPERIAPRGDNSAVARKRVAKGQGHEWALYLNDEWTVSPRISASVGLRFSGFQQAGPGIVYQYSPDLPPSPETATDSTLFAKGATIQSYDGWEPRLSLKIGLGPARSVKLSYNRLYQYTQLISNTAAATPVDIWQVSTPGIRPQLADNFSAGIFQNFRSNTWELSLEGYYRRLQDLVEFRDLPDLLLNPHLETELLSARGQAYGVELSVRKKFGALTGWMAYTYARTRVRTLGSFEETTVNGGRWYPAAFDQPHQFSTVGKWQPNPRHSITFNFVYQSGRPVTAPVGGYLLGNTYVPQYSDRNAFRIPDYHRLDLAYTFDNTEGKPKGFRGSFTLAIYNLYGRKNPFSVFFKRDENTEVPRAFRLAVLGSAIPAATFNFVF